MWPNEEMRFIFPMCGVNQSARALFSTDLGRSLCQRGDPAPRVVKDSSKHSVCNVCVCVMLLCLKAQCPAIMWCQIWWKSVWGLEKKKGKMRGIITIIIIFKYNNNTITIAIDPYVIYSVELGVDTGFEEGILGIHSRAGWWQRSVSFHYSE